MTEFATATSYKMGSTAQDWNVRIIFAEPLAYKDYSGYQDGYGVDAEKKRLVTCTSRVDGHTESVKVNITGTPLGGGTDAKAKITFPYKMAVGVYDVFLPYGLFRTQSGNVTAETRFQVTVIGDDSPLTLKSFSPAEGYEWDASEATQAKETDGAAVTATMTFDKVVASIAKPDATVLTASYGAVYHPEPYITILNKQSVAFSLGALPDGNYTLEVPAGVFVAINGMGNSPFTLHFSVKGSQSMQWALPFYNRPTTNPSNNAVVETLDEVTFAFSRNGFRAPSSLLKSTAEVLALTEEYPAGSDPNDPDARPTINSEPITGATLALNADGTLVVKMPYTINTKKRLLINVPEGAVNNLPGGGRSLSARERFEQGGCTNPAASVTVIVKGKTTVDPEGPDTPDPEQPGGGEEPDADKWALPTYTDVTVNPADGSTVKSLANISIALSHDDYDDPFAIVPNMGNAATATFVKGTTETLLEGLKATVVNGQFVITFPQPVNEAGRVVVTIPKGMTNNLMMPINSMTPQQIYEAGGCTNPAMTLTYYVVPEDLPVRDVTGLGYDTEYKKDADGNFAKDENGQYIRIDKYDSLVDAQLDPAAEDRVTVIYFWFDVPFTSINYQGGASVTNITTGIPMSIANVGFKSGGDSYRNNVIALRLSSDSYIYSEQLHQGIYEVVLPAGIATTAEGIKNGGLTFRFTFGDPSQAYHVEDVDLEPFVGDYEAVSIEGESDYGERFRLDKTDGAYVVSGLRQTPLNIPVGTRGTDFVLRPTKAGSYSFASPTGGDVKMLFQENEGDLYIFIDAFVIGSPDDPASEGGVTSYKRVELQATGIDPTSERPSHTASDPTYTLDGRRSAPATSSAPAVRIVAGAKRLK